MNCLYNWFPSAVFNGVDKFLSNFSVWDPYDTILFIIGQVSQMHQQCENIVRTIKCSHIILKLIWIYRNFFSCNHLYNLVTQPILIQVDVNFQCFVCLRLCPIVIELSTQHGFYNRFRIVN